MKLDFVTATQAAANVGQAFALLFGLVGLFVNPFLVFIAIFVWMGAASEAASARLRGVLGDVPVQSVMVTKFQILRPQDPLSVAIEHTLAGFQQDFPVVEQGKVVGVLTRAGFVKALTERGKDTPVSEVMQTDVTVVDPNEMVEPTLVRLRATPTRCFPVIRDGKILGLMTMENVADYLAIATALRARTAGLTVAKARPF
jgi:CBS-domain-containing membrane protein